MVAGAKLHVVWEGVRGRRLSKVSPILYRFTLYYYQSNVFTGVVMLYV